MQPGLPAYLYETFANDVQKLASKWLRDKIKVAISFAFMCDLQEVSDRHVTSVIHIFRTAMKPAQERWNFNGKLLLLPQH
jgi:hypothetical protein